MSDIKIVRLRGGEELIASVTISAETETVLLKKPCIILPTGEHQIGIAPWAFVCKESNGDGIAISRNEILYIGTPLDDLWNQYNSVFGSKLVVPEKNIESAPNTGLKLTY